jgi:hypothetical protein
VELVLDRYPIEYRQEVVQPLMHKAQRGESACLVGLAGVGKSNLMNFIAQEAVRRRYLGDEWQRTHFLGVVCTTGAQEPDIVFKAMLDAALALAGEIEPGRSIELVPGVSLFQALRSVLRFLCETHGQRVVFVLDEFEDAIRCQPVDLFDALRTLRDDQRATGRIQFVVITHRLPQLILSTPPFHSSRLYQILRDNIYPLPPYSQKDAEWMLDDLCRKRPGLELPPLAIRELLSYSGGHGGLLRALFEDLHPGFDVARGTLLGLAEQASKTRTSCEHIWTHLHRDEQAALRKLAAGRIVVPEWAAYLHRRGLIARNAPDGAIFSPVFARYIQVVQLASGKM